MKAYRTYVTVTDPQQVLLSNLPFQAGETVEVVMIGAEDHERTERVQRLQALLKETQSLPQAQALSDEDILREVAAYRNGQ